MTPKIFARILRAKRCPGVFRSLPGRKFIPLSLYHTLSNLSREIFGPLGLHNKLTIMWWCPWVADMCASRTDRPSMRGGHVSMQQLHGSCVRRWWTLVCQLQTPRPVDICMPAGDSCSCPPGVAICISAADLQVYITSLQFYYDRTFVRFT